MVISLNNQEESYYYTFPAGSCEGYKVMIDMNDRFRVICDAVDRGKVISERTIDIVANRLDIPTLIFHRMTKEEREQLKKKRREVLVAHNKFLYVGRLRAAYMASKVTIFNISTFTEVD